MSEGYPKMQEVKERQINDKSKIKAIMNQFTSVGHLLLVACAICLFSF